MPELDDMLPISEACEWLGLNKRTLLEKVKGRHPIIPAFRLSQKREYRFHPRTIIAKLAKDVGVELDVIAASFGISADAGARKQ